MLRRIAIGLGLLLVAGSVCTYAILRFTPWLGFSHTYAARDNDPYLTEIAKTAMPVIVAVKNEFSANGAYPKALTQIRTQLATQKIANINSDIVNGWHYTRSFNGEGFSLVCPLGWDPSLNYEWDGHREVWVFDPGDGSGPTTIRLDL